MATFEIEGNHLLVIGPDLAFESGKVDLGTLVQFLGDAGVLERFGWIDGDAAELDFEDRVRWEVEDAIAQALAEEGAQVRVDSAVDELTYYDDTDPYRYHDDNLHTGAVVYCTDPFCASARRTDTVISILKGE